MSVLKQNGELVMTRKQEFFVEDETELEKHRKKLEGHYGEKVLFIFKDERKKG